MRPKEKERGHSEAQRNAERQWQGRRNWDRTERNWDRTERNEENDRPEEADIEEKIYFAQNVLGSKIIVSNKTWLNPHKGNYLKCWPDSCLFKRPQTFFSWVECFNSFQIAN